MKLLIFYFIFGNVFKYKRKISYRFIDVYGGVIFEDKIRKLC